MFSALLRNNWQIEIIYLRLKHDGLKYNLYFIYVFLSLFLPLEIFYATIFPMTKYIYLKYSNSSSFVLVFLSNHIMANGLYQIDGEWLMFISLDLTCDVNSLFLIFPILTFLAFS